MISPLIMGLFISIFIISYSCTPLNKTTTNIENTNKLINSTDFISRIYRIQFKYPQNIKILNTFDNLNELENDLINTSKNSLKIILLQKNKKLFQEKMR